MRALLLVLLVALGCAPARIVPTPTKTVADAPFVPTSPEVVEAMLDLAGVTPEDVVYDLGSGDGRIVLAAARRGARAVGVELDADLVAQSRAAASAAGLAGLAEFHHGDVFEADVSGATVVTMYLFPSMTERLRPRLEALRPGSRIVSHIFGIGDWPPDRMVEVGDRTIYLFTVR